MEFLENPDQYEFDLLFTPKHCLVAQSNRKWFGYTLQKQRLKNESFTSIEELETKMIAYIEFTNFWFAKPYKWKFKGFNKGSKQVYIG